MLSSSPDARNSPDGDHRTAFTARWCLDRSEAKSNWMVPLSAGLMYQICDEPQIEIQLTMSTIRRLNGLFHSLPSLTKTCESVPPDAKRVMNGSSSLVVWGFGWMSTLSTGSRLCHEISGIVHFIVRKSVNLCGRSKFHTEMQAMKFFANTFRRHFKFGFYRNFVIKQFACTTPFCQLPPKTTLSIVHCSQHYNAENRLGAVWWRSLAGNLVWRIKWKFSFRKPRWV